MNRGKNYREVLSKGNENRFEKLGFLKKMLYCIGRQAPVDR